MKSITIAGNLGKPAELRQTQKGDSVTSFGVAVQTYENGQKGTLWFDVSWWGQRAAKLQPHLAKGSRVAVSGDLGTREYNGKTYITVRATDVTLLGGGQQSSGNGQGYSNDPGRQASSGGGYGADLDEDVPFAPQVL